MKRVLLLVLVALMVTTIAFAGGRQEAGPRQVRLGVTIEDFNDVFMRFLLDELTAEAQSRGAQVVAADGRRDPNEQIKQVENFITQGVDAIIIHVIDQTLAPRITELANESGIPLVYVNRRPSDNALNGAKVVAVASPEPVAGRLQAEYVVENMGTSGNVVILLGSLGSAPQIGRTEGAKEVFSRYPNINVIREQTANFQRAEAVAVVENWLASGDTINAIVANNDEMALGAVLVLEEKGLADRVIVTGVDATPEARQFVEAGRLDMTVFQNGGAQGRGAVDAAMKLIADESVPKFVEIPFEPVTRANVANYR